MKSIQAVIIAVVTVGLTWLALNLKRSDYRSIDTEYRVLTAVLGNSHENNLLIDEVFRPYYLNISGASMLEQSYQLGMAIDEFPALRIVLIDLSPIEFIECGIFNTRVGENFFFESSVRHYPWNSWLNELSVLLPYNPTQLYRDRSIAFHQGRISTIESEPSQDYSRDSHFENCGNQASASYSDQLVSLQRMITTSISRGIYPIDVVTPHHRIYRAVFEGHRSYKKLISRIVDDLSVKPGQYCFVDMYDLSLEDKFFNDGDHINLAGGRQIQRSFSAEVKRCLEQAGESVGEVLQ
jgi:hypothetical protein